MGFISTITAWIKRPKELNAVGETRKALEVDRPLLNLEPGFHKDGTLAEISITKGDLKIIQMPFVVDKDTCYFIYTDGACDYNGKAHAKGSWAFYVPASRIQRSGLLITLATDEWHSNNKAELTAIIKALEYAKQTGMRRVKIHTDSKYCIGCIGGTMLPVKNQLYFTEINALAQFFDSIELEYVAAHVNNHFNNLVDDLCRRELGKGGIRPNYKYAKGYGKFKRKPR